MLFTNTSYVSWTEPIIISSKKHFIKLAFELLYAQKIINSELFKNTWDSFANQVVFPFIF